MSSLNRFTQFSLFSFLINCVFYFVFVMFRAILAHGKFDQKILEIPTCSRSAQAQLPHYQHPPSWSQLMNLHWHIIITQSLQFIQGSLLMLYVLWVWTLYPNILYNITSCIHYYGIIQNIFTVLKSPLYLSIHPSSLQPITDLFGIFIILYFPRCIIIELYNMQHFQISSFY